MFSSLQGPLVGMNDLLSGRSGGDIMQCHQVLKVTHYTLTRPCLCDILTSLMPHSKVSLPSVNQSCWGGTLVTVATIWQVA